MESRPAPTVARRRRRDEADLPKDKREDRTDAPEESESVEAACNRGLPLFPDEFSIIPVDPSAPGGNGNGGNGKNGSSNRSTHPGIRFLHYVPLPLRHIGCMWLDQGYEDRRCGKTPAWTMGANLSIARLYCEYHGKIIAARRRETNERYLRRKRKAQQKSAP